MAAAKKTTTAEKVPAPEQQHYTVLARRYRPQQFRDLVGQEPVARALVNALEGNRVAHAYLFTGARGVGKTSAARILAKALNCEKGPTATPCDQCENCRAIATGEDVDVLEIDGASNRGIEEIREIRANVQYRPARSRYRIYIIDEVHMLTKEAFNALLKTLEEPPSHVKFIFATTEAQKIPLTILSRCQRFDFAGISTNRIRDRLRGVLADEGASADEEALELIARRAAGSMRDAQSLLDQVLAFGGGDGKALTADLVHRLLGTAHEDRVAELAKAVLDRSPREALALLDQSLGEGLHLGELVDQLIDYWRDLMVVQCAGAEGRDLNVTSKHRDTLVRQAEKLSLDTILAGLDILSATRGRLRGTMHGRVVVEMALVRLARLEDLVPLTQLARWLDGDREAGPPKAAEKPSKPASRGSAPGQADRQKPRGQVETEVVPALAITPETLIHVWDRVLEGLPPIHAAQLRKGVVAISGPNTLAIQFSQGYNHERDYCQESSKAARVEEALRNVTGQAWGFRIEARNDAIASPAPGAPPQPPVPRSQTRRAEAMREPVVRRAIEDFGAQLLSADEGFGAPVDEASSNGSADMAGDKASGAETRED